MVENLLHAFERLTRALRPMATGSGMLQERLDSAFRGMLGLSREELPEESQDAFQEICDRLVQTSSKPLTNDEAKHLAARLFDVYVHVNQRGAGIA